MRSCVKGRSVGTWETAALGGVYISSSGSLSCLGFLFSCLLGSHILKALAAKAPQSFFPKNKDHCPQLYSVSIHCLLGSPHLCELCHSYPHGYYSGLSLRVHCLCSSWSINSWLQNSWAIPSILRARQGFSWEHPQSWAESPAFH